MKKAFTLIELLVVIAIIGVITAALITTFGSATESAQAAICLNNMRSLAMAANARAMRTNRYPTAGSVELMGLEAGGGGSYYAPQPGWISWLSRGNYDDGHGNEHAKNHQSNEIPPFYGTGNEDDMQFALTNGTLWKATSGDRGLYVCPVHRNYAKKHGVATPRWSYVMNARFGWDYSEGEKAIGTVGSGFGVWYNTLTRPDKTLMFAELPTVDPETGLDLCKECTGLKADAVLQYQEVKASDGSKGQYASSSGKAESIGFVHKAGKRDRCAHVAFADGHTEKLIWRDGGVSPKELTAYLCRGWDVTFSEGSGWKLAQDADRAE